MEKTIDFSELKIWVVEDDTPSVGVIRRLLEAMGASQATVVTKIKPVTEAMQRGEPIDILLIDVHVNEQSGYELLAQIQQNPRYAATKNIMFSATSGILGVRQAQEAHADGFITKPLTLDKLRRAFTTVLENQNFWE